MSDRSDLLPEGDTTPIEDLSRQAGRDGAHEEEIPVEELIRLTRELTQRITNLDRQRVALQLKDARRTIKSNVPVLLQQFFTGEIDLDSELAKRFVNAPLLSEINLHPQRPAAMLPSRRAGAYLRSQDNAAQLSVDLDIKSGALEITFTLGSMLAFRFDIGMIDEHEQQQWLDLMRRQSGIAFLWTAKRWESDYIIFVIRENFARLYAFSPGRFEAAARITPDILLELLDWLEAFWFPELEVIIAPPQEPVTGIAGASVQGDYLGFAAPIDDQPDEDQWSQFESDPYDPPDEEW
jgi:hypothetical protein